MTYRFDLVGDLPVPMELSFPKGMLQVTRWPTVTPEPGRALWESYGICGHHFGKGVYADVDAWTAKVADLGVHVVRSGAYAKLDTVKRLVARARALGFKLLGTLANEGTTEDELRANLAFVLANRDVYIGVEGINEPDQDGLTDAEVAKTVKFQRIIFNYVVSRPELSQLTVLSPALRRPAGPNLYQRFADAGLPGNFHAVSLHHYLNGPPDVVDLAEHLDMVADRWRCDRFWVTETGGTTATASTDPRRNTEAALAAYAVRTLLEFTADPRVDRVFRYELLDDDAPLTNNEAHFGVYGIDKPKPEVAHIQRLARLTADDSSAVPDDVDLEIVAPLGVSHKVTQVATKPPVVWLWRPSTLHDVAPVGVRLVTPAGEQTVPVAGAAVGAPLGV